MARKLKVKQVRSYIGRPERQRETLRGVGLGRINRTVFLDDTPQIRGMLKKVCHLVSVEEVEVQKR